MREEGRLKTAERDRQSGNYDKVSGGLKTVVKHTEGEELKRTARKSLILTAVMIFCCMMLAIPAQAKTVTAKSYTLKDVRKAEKPQGTWVKKTQGYRFRRANGTPVKSRWINVDGKIYYLNSKGYKVTGSWIKYRGNRYYVDRNGVMKTGWLTLGKKTYYLRVNGCAAKGLCSISGAKYYFDSENARKSGWVKHGKYQYYFDAKTGKMKTSGWVKTGSKYYYVGADGRRKKSCWIAVGKNKYYLDSDGARVTGTQYIGNKGYYFKSNGVYDPKVTVKMEVNPRKKMVALTFDDGPGPYTARLLNCLQNNGAKATFFMVGSSVSSYKSVVKRMANMGCELGNHSYSHPAFTTLSTSSMRSQVTRTNSKIKSAAGKAPTVFRLPYGDGASNRTVLSTLGLPSIYWSIDTRDWANTGNPQHTVNAVLNNVRNGDIILMHDIHLSTVKAAEIIIPALKKRGYQMVTVSQLAKYKGGTTMKSGKTYYKFR